MMLKLVAVHNFLHKLANISKFEYHLPHGLLKHRIYYLWLKQESYYRIVRHWATLVRVRSYAVKQYTEPITLVQKSSQSPLLFYKGLACLALCKVKRMDFCLSSYRLWVAKQLTRLCFLCTPWLVKCRSCVMRWLTQKGSKGKLVIELRIIVIDSVVVRGVIWRWFSAP